MGDRRLADHEKESKNLKRGRPSTFKEAKRNLASRTLYVCNIAAHTSTTALENLFKDMEGFLQLRRVRQMAFVDFVEKQQATNALTKSNGYRFKPDEEGLYVSYDKDDGEERGGWSVRQREEEKRARSAREATRVVYNCSACAHFCMKLARHLEEMPERRTDNSRVVDMAKDMCLLAVVKGEVKTIKREKGLEKQYRYNCELCDICIAYRPVPFTQETKFIYVFPNALVEGGKGPYRKTPFEPGPPVSFGTLPVPSGDGVLGAPPPPPPLPPGVSIPPPPPVGQPGSVDGGAAGSASSQPGDSPDGSGAKCVDADGADATSGGAGGEGLSDGAKAGVDGEAGGQGSIREAGNDAGDEEVAAQNEPQ
eukprot:jgi/Mesvir1/8673/Mv02613-RA.1